MSMATAEKRTVSALDVRPLRVLMVTGAYPTPHRPHWGTFIKSQVESLRTAGVEVDVIHPPDGPVPVRYARALGAVLARSLPRRYDVIHGHYGLWCLIARLQWTTPVIASFLGDDLLGTPDENGTNSRKSMLVVRLSQWLASHVDAAIVKSRQMGDRIVGNAPVVLPNGVNFSVFHPIDRQQARAYLGWRPDRHYVLFGNDPGIPRKAFPLAQAAVRALQDEGVDVELVVANGLPHADLVWYLNASDALILTSLSEGSPNIVKEAMACNVPVVSVDVGDVKEVIGRTVGCAVCDRDAGDLARGLRAALARTEPTTGRDDVAHLDSSVVARDLVALYRQVAGRQARSLVDA